jgi:hypothetical protein
MEKEWEEKSAEEKRDELFQRWLYPAGVEFINLEAEKAYRERVTRFKDSIELKKPPDRVPVYPMIGFFPAYYTGFTPEDMMYDYDKLRMSYKKYVLDFAPDAHSGLVVASPGKFYEILDYKLYSWPGHGVAPQYPYQFNEGEYMRPDEYDTLIQDPSYFFGSIYFPRIFGSLRSFAQLSPFTRVLEMYGSFSATHFAQYGLQEVQDAYKKIFEAGTEVLKWMGVVNAYDIEMKSMGFPGFFGGGTKAPFDTIGDTLRGTRGIMLDMYRQPDKLIKAMEVVTPLLIKMGASRAKKNGNPIIFIPLHKGADGFLSDQQYKTFYWPTFKQLLLGLINEGCVPFPWAEGGYESRLEVIKDIPKAKVIWGFDTTDMTKAKKILGGVACISGNMPLDLLTVGTSQQVKDRVIQLIETCASGGGYIMMNGAVIEDVNPENVRIMIETTKEYGKY